LMIIGLAAVLPGALYHGLVAQGVPSGPAGRAASLPPVASLFAAFLGYNPMQSLLGHATLAGLPHAQAAFITGRSFFPSLLSKPFSKGLHEAFTFAAAACVVAAGASWLRGGKYVHTDHHSLTEDLGSGLFESGEVAAAEVGAGVLVDD
jgi:hypothetical protein